MYLMCFKIMNGRAMMNGNKNHGVKETLPPSVTMNAREKKVIMCVGGVRTLS